MSLQNKRTQLSQKKGYKRNKSVQNKHKISFQNQKEEKYEISVDDMLEKTIKLVNQAISMQVSNYGRDLTLLNNSDNSLQQRIAIQVQNNQSLGQKQKYEQLNAFPQQKSDNVNAVSGPASYFWQKIKIQQKRKLKGIKSKIRWNNSKDNTFIIIRTILTDNYTRLNEPDFFLQLDSANIDLSRDEQKLIQKYINTIIQQQQLKIQQQKSQTFYWLKNILTTCHNFFMKMKLTDKSFKSKQILYEFKRHCINDNYIPYPNPASITWSPHGMLCLSENKVGTINKSIVGSIYSYRKILEAPYKFERFTKKLNQTDDLKMVDEKNQQKLEETTQAQFFGWDAKQQINFSVFGRTGEEQQIEEQSKPKQVTTSISLNSLHQKQNQKGQKLQKHITKDFEIFKGIIPTKIQKIYRRFFHSNSQNIQFQFLQKLKIFAVKSQNVDLEDGIVYLIDKIQKHNRFGVTQALIQNQFTGYHNAFMSDKNKRSSSISKINSLKSLNTGNSNISPNTLSFSRPESNSFSNLNPSAINTCSHHPKFKKFKYQLISQFLQQKIKVTPHCQQFLYMKSVLLENQYFRLALENYFQDNFRKLGICGTGQKLEVQLQSLGTYDNFDDIRAQKLLLRLIQQLLATEKKLKQDAQKIKTKYAKKPQKYDDPLYKDKKYQKIKQENQQMKLLLKGYVRKVNRNLPQLIQVQSGYRKLSVRQSQIQQQMEQRQQQLRGQAQIQTRNPNLSLVPFVIIPRIEFQQFQFSMILSPPQRRNFLQTIIPILWIKDRSMEKFQYKIAKRVIIANSKIVNFLEKLNNIGNIWKKADRSRRNIFFRNLLREYRKYEAASLGALIGKKYIAYCQLCMVEFQAYSIQELLRVTRCERCKFC